jgi:hypothetical protein
MLRISKIVKKIRFINKKSNISLINKAISLEKS